mgnify:FL=1
MSSTDAIFQLFGTLKRHREIVAQAYLKNNKQISYSIETEAAVNALLKQKLAWHLDEFDGVQLSSKLVTLLDQAVRSERRLQIGDSVGRLWTELGGHLSDYRISQNEHDKELTKLSLQECAHDLIEEINQAVGRYARFIDRGYAFAQSIEVRLQQNERVLKRATELAEMMEACDLTDYQQATGEDPLLRKLFCRYLPQAFERARKEFRRAIGDLQALITKIREEQALSGLIHCFQS